MELEKRCLDLMQEVELVSDRQEVLAGLVVSKRDMQKDAPKKISVEDLRGVQGAARTKKHVLLKRKGERERARMLQRLGGSRAIRHWNGARDTMSVESCSSSMAHFPTDLRRSVQLEKTTGFLLSPFLPNGILSFCSQHHGSL